MVTASFFVKFMLKNGDCHPFFSYILSMEKLFNGRKPLYFILIAFALGIVFGLAIRAPGAGDGSTEHGEFRERLEQVNRDLRTAIESQQEARERAARLQAELIRVTEYAGKLEAGTRRAETRTESLAEQLNGITERSGELADGIDRASVSLKDSRVLLDELGILLQSLPGNSGKEN